MIGALLAYLVVMHWKRNLVGLCQLHQLERGVQDDIKRLKQGDISWIWSRALAEGGVGYDVFQSLVWRGLLEAKDIVSISENFLNDLTVMEKRIQHAEEVLFTFDVRIRMLLALMVLVRALCMERHMWFWLSVSPADLCGIVVGVLFLMVIRQVCRSKWSAALGWSRTGFLQAQNKRESAATLTEMMPLVEFSAIALASAFWIGGVFWSTWMNSTASRI